MILLSVFYLPTSNIGHIRSSRLRLNRKIHWSRPKIMGVRHLLAEIAVVSFVVQSYALVTEKQRVAFFVLYFAVSFALASIVEAFLRLLRGFIIVDADRVVGSIC